MFTLIPQAASQAYTPCNEVFLHPYNETPWEDQLTKESIIERTVRAVTHAKQTLLAGFTTVRSVSLSFSVVHHPEPEPFPETWAQKVPEMRTYL